MEGDPDQTVDAEVSVAPASQIVVERADYPTLRMIERDHYVIVGEIAKGGMGRVLEARDRRLGRRVAIKELLPKHRDAARRFEREARITARLQHPAIVHVYEAGTWPGGEPFYAMTCVDGRSLGSVIAERATLNDRLGLLPHVIATADALAYAHNHHVIHRDLKPSNVLVGEFGETVVVEWGLAKDLSGGDSGDSLQPWSQASEEQTRSGSIVGTPAYMPPEQARGELVDCRADVYALGALLYTLLVGSPPYSGGSSDDIVAQVVAAPPPPVHAREPGAPRDLVAIVAKAMARDPAERYADAGELTADLKRFQTGQLVAAHRYTTRQLFVRWLRRRKLVLLATTGVIAVIATVATFSVIRILSEKARAEARRFALLEERGRSELLVGHAGRALAYLTGATRDGARGGARGFLVAQAMRPFQAELARLDGGPLLAVSADGTRIATAGFGPIVVRRDDGSVVQTVGDHHGVQTLAWDVAGTQLVAAGDGGVAWVWTNGRVVELAAGTPITDATFDPSGGRVALGQRDGTVDVWDVEHATRIARTRCHDGAVTAVHFSNAGDRIASASEDGTACVWVVAKPDLLVLLRGHLRPVIDAKWIGQDDRWIVTGSEDGTARVWDTAGGKLVVSPLRHEGTAAITQVVVSHDARLVLTTASDGTARVWELPAHPPDPGSVAPARLHATLVGHEGQILTAAFSADDTLIATGGSDRHANLWDPVRGRLLASFEHDDIVTTVAFARADRELVAGVGTRGAVLWDARLDKQHIELESAVHAIAVAPDGAVAAGTDDSLVTLVRDDRRSVLRGHVGRVRAVAFTPDGRTLVTAGDDSRPLVWDVATERVRGNLGEHAAPITAIAIAATGRTVATVAAGRVELWTIAGAHVATFAPAGRAVTAIAFDRDGGLMAGLDDGEVTRWTPEAEHSWRALHGPVTALALAPTGDRLVVAGRDEAILFAHTTAWIPRVALDAPGAIRAAAFTNDGSRVVTAGETGFEVWDAAAGKVLAAHNANVGTLEAIAVARDTLWTASADHSIAAWDVRSETASRDVVATFTRLHDPWWLDDDDVVRIREDRDGQR
ncbi:MAG: protein kinase [Kofleriaceae bacterium]